MSRVIIVGSGLAAYSVAREWRKLNKQDSLQIITADAGEFYSKPVLSNALAQGKSVQQLATQTAADMAQQLDADIKTHTRVDAIEPDSKSLRTSAGTISYDKLVLAVGAQPIKPPLQGDAVDDVFSINHLDDYVRFRAALVGKQHIAIIGAGLIACEFADDLASAGFSVSVIAPDAYPLGRLVPEALGRKLQSALQNAHPIHWLLSRTVTTISRKDKAYTLQLSDDSCLEADLVLSATGLRANTLLAENAGLQVKRGINCDAFLQSSEKDIFALGDCAEVAGHFLPFVMPIMHCARALAKTLTGEMTAVSYPAMPVAVKTTSYPLVVMPPPVDCQGQWQLDADDDQGMRLLFRNEENQLAGFALSAAYCKQRTELAKALPRLL